jgi:uncharacterized protein YciI
MFVLILKYKEPIETVMNYLDAHKEFLDKYYKLNKFICSGRQEPRTGGIIICNGEDKAEVNLIIKQDPFYENNIAEYEIIEFIPTNYAEGFKEFIR